MARLRSLDIFRGAAVALMILVNNPGSWSALYPPLAHAAWHGCTPTDLVFPFFLFAVGNALAWQVPDAMAATPAFWRRVLRRTLVIFALGLFLNASPFFTWQRTSAIADPASEPIGRSVALDIGIDPISYPASYGVRDTASCFAVVP